MKFKKNFAGMNRQADAKGQGEIVVKKTGRSKVESRKQDTQRTQKNRIGNLRKASSNTMRNLLMMEIQDRSENSLAFTS